jgi:hypothetical protein
LILKNIVAGRNNAIKIKISGTTATTACLKIFDNLSLELYNKIFYKKTYFGFLF